MYREYPPPSELAPFVECFWRHERSHPDPADSGVILPDGRVDVVWASEGQALLAGPQTRFLTRPLQAPFVAVGVRFHPGVVSSLLGLAAHELVDLHVPLTAVDTRPAARLIDQLAALSDPDQAVGVLGGAVAKLAGRTDHVDPLVRRATHLLDEPQTTVRGLASELALSERQLQRRFREAVGYGPKMLQRILRFRRFVSELGRERNGAGGLARIAASTGYADQAHLTRESRQLSGFSPVQLEQLSRA